MNQPVYGADPHSPEDPPHGRGGPPSRAGASGAVNPFAPPAGRPDTEVDRFNEPTIIATPVGTARVGDPAGPGGPAGAGSPAGVGSPAGIGGPAGPGDDADGGTTELRTLPALIEPTERRAPIFPPEPPAAASAPVPPPPQPEAAPPPPGFPPPEAPEDHKPLDGELVGERPEPRRRGPWVPALAATTALFVVVSVVMMVLFLQKDRAYDKQQHTVATQGRTISDQKKQIAGLDKQLGSTKKDLEDTQKNLKAAQSKNGVVADQKANISKCIDLMSQLIEAVSEKDAKKIDDLNKQAAAPCKAAKEAIK